MGRENWDLKDDRERSPFQYLLPSGAWFQNVQPTVKLYEGGSRENLIPAQPIMADIPSGVELFLFGADFCLGGWARQLYNGIAVAPPADYPFPEHGTSVQPVNDLTKVTYVTGADGRQNWGHKEAVNATITNGTAVLGYPALALFLDRGFNDGQDPLPFFVDFLLFWEGSGVYGVPFQGGSPAAGEEPAIDAWIPGIIPEALYDSTVQATNNWIQVGNTRVYVVGLWQG